MSEGHDVNGNAHVCVYARGLLNCYIIEVHGTNMEVMATVK
jgi:hypothetical protein